MKSKFLERLDFVRAGLRVRRQHTVPTVCEEHVGQHSAGVALLLMLMWPTDGLPRAELLAAALAHDLGESRIGDIPSPFKRSLSASARAELDTMENSPLAEHGLLYDLTSEEQQWLKFADCCDGLCYCIEERTRGNRMVYEMGENYATYINNAVSTLRQRMVAQELTARWREANQ